MRRRHLGPPILPAIFDAVLGQFPTLIRTPLLPDAISRRKSDKPTMNES